VTFELLADGEINLFDTESEKHKDPRNQDPRKVWESEEGLPKNSRLMSRFETNGASLALILPLIVRKEHSQSPNSILPCINVATHCENGTLSESYLYPHLPRCCSL
jgi:hypothetical protein